MTYITDIPIMSLKRRMSVSMPENIHPGKDIFKEQTIVISLTGFDLERSEEGLFKSNAATEKYFTADIPY